MGEGVTTAGGAVAGSAPPIVAAAPLPSASPTGVAAAEDTAPAGDSASDPLLCSLAGAAAPSASEGVALAVASSDARPVVSSSGCGASDARLFALSRLRGPWLLLLLPAPLPRFMRCFPVKPFTPMPPDFSLPKSAGKLSKRERIERSEPPPPPPPPPAMMLSADAFSPMAGVLRLRRLRRSADAWFECSLRRRVVRGDVARGVDDDAGDDAGDIGDDSDGEDDTEESPPLLLPRGDRGLRDRGDKRPKPPPLLPFPEAAGESGDTGLLCFFIFILNLSSAVVPGFGGCAASKRCRWMRVDLACRFCQSS